MDFKITEAPPTIIERFVSLAEKYKYTNFMLSLAFLGVLIFNQKSITLIGLACFLFVIETIKIFKKDNK